MTVQENLEQENSGKLLDFIIIGAQKAGTTSLFEYLRRHPAIYMPPEKEAPFFSRDERFAKGWKWYAGEYFGRAPAEKLWGKATPHYMTDHYVPARIHELMPRVKLIAILRNPVDRAFSHYRMALSRGYEKRTFDEAISELIQEESLGYSRSLRNVRKEKETHCYVAWGEYARILQGYRQFFDKDRVLVAFTEKLDKEPHGVINSILQFLNLDTDFLPSNLGKRYRVSGNQRQFHRIYKLKKISLFYAICRKIPERYRRRFWSWSDQREGVGGEFADMLPETRKKLVHFYRKDVEQLIPLIERSVPWPEFS